LSRSKENARKNLCIHIKEAIYNKGIDAALMLIHCGDCIDTAYNCNCFSCMFCTCSVCGTFYDISCSTMYDLLEEEKENIISEMEKKQKHEEQLRKNSTLTDFLIKGV